jgi:hypothetical protein
MSRPVPIPQTRRRFSASGEGSSSHFTGHATHGHAQSMPAALHGHFGHQFHGSYMGHDQQQDVYHHHDNHHAGNHHWENQLFHHDMQHALQGNELPLEPPLHNHPNSLDFLGHIPLAQRASLLSHDDLREVGPSGDQVPASTPEDELITNFDRPFIPPHVLIDRANSEQMCRSLSSKKTPFNLRDCLL